MTEENKENILQEAHRIIALDRRKDYGDASECCEKVAAGWSVILGMKVTAEQFCLCMVWLKTVRECQGPKRDNLVDIAGYARVLELVKESQQGMEDIFSVG